MVIEIKKEDTPEDVERKLKEFSSKVTADKRGRLNKFLGVLKLKEDAVVLQRKWRDEW